jgi:hypothetical protein
MRSRINWKVAGPASLIGAGAVVAGLAVSNFDRAALSEVLIHTGTAIGLVLVLVLLERGLFVHAAAVAREVASETVERETAGLRERLVRLENLDAAQAEERVRRRHAAAAALQRLFDDRLSAATVGEVLTYAYHEKLARNWTTEAVRCSHDNVWGRRPGSSWGLPKPKPLCPGSGALYPDVARRPCRVARVGRRGRGRRRHRRGGGREVRHGRCRPGGSPRRDRRGDERRARSCKEWCQHHAFAGRCRTGMRAQQHGIGPGERDREEDKHCHGKRPSRSLHAAHDPPVPSREPQHQTRTPWAPERFACDWTFGSINGARDARPAGTPVQKPG